MDPSRRRWIYISLLALVASGAVIYVLGSYRGKKWAESMNCASSMVSISCAGRMWAQDHDGHFPTNFLSMSNELVTPKILSCLSERRTDLWSSLTASNCTYEVVSPGVSEGASDAVFIRCSVHGHVGYTDMTVFDGHRRRGKFDWR
jgi:hypothetical protein